jgi:SSS family solute:Na+ symporter
VLSNLVQIVVLAAGAVVLAWKALAAAGGPAQLASGVGALGPSTLDSFPPWHDPVFPAVACLAWLIGTSVGYGGDAAPMGGAVEGQRILSCRNPKEACKMYITAEVVLFTLVWLVSIPCLAAATFWPQLRSGGLDRELAYGLLMTEYLGPGLLGLVYVAMLGGITSVVGDNLNFGSQVLLNDIYRRHLVKHASERHYLLAGKLAIFVILGLAVLVVYKVTFLFDVAIFMVGLSAAEMSANWAQWWWWRFNGWGRVAASFGGAAVYTTMVLLWPGMEWWTRMYAAMLISTALWIAATLATAPEREELLLAFYRRARPLGSWGPVGRLAEADGPQHARDWGPIGKGIVLALAGAAAVMAYIVGISRLYVGQYRGATLMLGAALVLGFLFWIRLQPYMRGLLSAEEKAELKASELEGASDIQSFGLAGVGAVACFSLAGIFGFNFLFVAGGRTPLVLLSASGAVILALWLRHKHNAADRRDRPKGVLRPAGRSRLWIWR